MGKLGVVELRGSLMDHGVGSNARGRTVVFVCRSGGEILAEVSFFVCVVVEGDGRKLRGRLGLCIFLLRSLAWDLAAPGSLNALHVCVG